MQRLPLAWDDERDVLRKQRMRIAKFFGLDEQA
jgi:hypothetical protein